jgi:tetratricopeptide (TPR) repeat protein
MQTRTDKRLQKIDADDLGKLIVNTPLNSNDHNIYIYRGVNSNQRKLLFDSYSKLLDQDKSNPYAYMWRGLCAKLYTRYMDYPLDEDYNIKNMSRVDLDKRNFFQRVATESFYQAYSRKSKDPMIQGEYAAFFLESNRMQTDIKRLFGILENATKLAPKYPRLLRLLGNAYDETGRVQYSPEKAIQAYKRALVLDPNYAAVYNDALWACYTAKRWQEAKIWANQYREFFADGMKKNKPLNDIEKNIDLHIKQLK